MYPFETDEVNESHPVSMKFCTFFKLQLTSALFFATL